MKAVSAALRAFAWVLFLGLLITACGSTGDASSHSGRGSEGAGGRGGSQAASGSQGATNPSLAGGTGGDIGVGGKPIVSFSVEPPSAQLELPVHTSGTQAFQAVAHYADGTSGVLTDVSWSADGLALGSIDGSGVFTATGELGGLAKVTAKSGSSVATADLMVRIHVSFVGPNVSAAAQAALDGASGADASITWAYPYDGTVFPRGIAGPPLMWMGGLTTDAYRFHWQSASYELDAYATLLPGRYDLDAALWEQMSRSTSGALTLDVARFDGAAAKTVLHHQYSIAPASMRGSIYYWAIDTGRVMRIKPGATAPDDFLSSESAYTTCPSCHTVSADGARLVMNEGSWPNEVSVSRNIAAQTDDLKTLPSGGSGASRWALAGLSADGKVVVENFASLRGDIGKVTGAFDSVTGAVIPNSGLDKPLHMPAFSPDDQLLAYIDGVGGDLRAFDWSAADRKASGDRLLVAAGGASATKILGFPSATPDHQWVAYQRSSALGSMGNAGDLYLASVATPGVEIALDALNGASYPFAAGDRDRHLSYEPTFAPVAAGGYFWVVFHSRRTFGNALTGDAYTGEGKGVKQLWVAAIDQNPVAGKDPSHPAFRLPGQSIGTLNMRGYWALDPCKADGLGCDSGVDCCGGYCDPGDGGVAMCKSMSSGCSSSGDHCATAADCCDHALVCINGVCSEEAPH